MFFRQLYEEGLAHASYIVGCPERGRALVVDPRRDIDEYLHVAAENDLTITDVTETHIHADFVSGARELAAATGATLHVSGSGGPDWTYRGLPAESHVMRDGAVIAVGDVSVRPMETPGHTPEHVTFVVSDGDASKEPMIAMTGDFVFVGDIGRPDLLEAAVGVAGSAQASARTMFASLRDKFATIPDFVTIWPAHGAGSACGKALSAVPASTAGYERRTAWWAPYIERGDESGFVRELLDGQVDAPLYFARMKRLNRDGPPLLGSLPVPQRLDGAGLRKAAEIGVTIVDARPKERFRAGHVRGALSIPDESSFATRSGWFVDPATPVVLVCAPKRLGALVRALVRVGLDDIAGWVGEDDAALASLPSEGLATVDAARLYDVWQRRTGTILDVRNANEYRHGHIPGATLIPASRLAASLDRVPRDTPVYVHCAGGGRSNSASSLLSARGFTQVSDVEGGFGAWSDAGFAEEHES
jgi:hydroxyacylglutathione hydrolase